MRTSTISPDTKSRWATMADFTDELLDSDPDFCRLLLRQHHERVEQSARHSQEFVRYVLVAKRQQKEVP